MENNSIFFFIEKKKKNDFSPAVKGKTHAVAELTLSANNPTTVPINAPIAVEALYFNFSKF